MNTLAPAARRSRRHARLARDLVAGAFAMASIVSTTACHEGPPPAYVRLDETAPNLAGLPATRAVLVVFWASWCAPCREETPSLVRLAENPPPQLLVVVFGHADSPDAVRRFFHGEPPSALSYRPDEADAASRAFGIDTLPASVLVVTGRTKARFSGPRNWDSREMRRLLARLMEEETRPSAPR